MRLLPKSEARLATFRITRKSNHDYLATIRISSGMAEYTACGVVYSAVMSLATEQQPLVDSDSTIVDQNDQNLLNYFRSAEFVNYDKDKDGACGHFDLEILEQ
jgi:hypothetical protein